MRILDEVIGDVRYALRGFGRNKGFAAAAIVTLALGSGASASSGGPVHGHPRAALADRTQRTVVTRSWIVR